MRLGTCLAGVLASLLTATLAEADGGALILREERGPWIVTLLAEPTPLREGPAVLEVLVQSAATGEPMLDADVRLRLTASGADHALEVQTHPDAAGNRLFRGARLYLPSPGPCQLEVLVTSSDHHETLRAPVDVAPRQGPARRYWTYILATPLGVALLALHQARSLAGRGRRRAMAPNRSSQHRKARPVEPFRIP
jgi:hypothetical protein